MYVDIRDEEDAHGDTMESWDEDHLRSVVARKHGKEGQSKPKTDKAGTRVYLRGRGVYRCVCSWEGEGCTCVCSWEGEGCTGVCVCV